jgi:F420-dependent oxidoreductase-like protein
MKGLPMKLGMLIGYSGAQLNLPMDLVLEAEKLGFSSVWTAEAYGSDAVTTAAWILANTSKIKVGTAIMQMPARQPAMAAMTAMTLQQLSGNRFLMGIGPSGPQVAEGWYGMPYGKPITRTREYIAIIREIFERKGPVSFDGDQYQLPYNGPGATGLGKPLKSILHPDPDQKIYTAAITHAGIKLAAEVADGFFPVWMNPERYDLFQPSIEEGFAAAKAPKTLKEFDIAPFVSVALGDDLDQCRFPAKGMLALYIGGMGAREKNFYNDFAKRMGYEDAAAKIQELYLDGKKFEAMAAVPDELVDEVALIGPEGRIRERLQAWKQAGRDNHVGSMLIGSGQVEALRIIADEVL